MTDPEATLILKRSDVRKLASVQDYHEAVAGGFRAFAAGAVDAPPPMEIAGADGAFHAKGASMTIGGRRLAALKVNGNFPLNPARGSPTIQGAILLFAANDGALLAVLDSIEITLRRTAAASAVAADLLARASAQTLLICGCGVQGRAHAEAIAPLRAIKRAFAYDSNAAKARSFAEETSAALNLRFDAVERLEDASIESDIIVTTTTARSPLFFPGHVKAGSFIAAVGADNPHKIEIAPALMKKSIVVTDVTAQCEIMGDLRAAIADDAKVRDNVRGELGEMLAGTKAGRRTDEEIIIFDSTGAAFQDLASAAMIYERAGRSGTGQIAALRD